MRDLKANDNNKVAGGRIDSDVTPRNVIYDGYICNNPDCELYKKGVFGSKNCPMCGSKASRASKADVPTDYIEL